MQIMRELDGMNDHTRLASQVVQQPAIGRCKRCLAGARGQSQFADLLTLMH